MKIEPLGHRLKLIEQSTTGRQHIRSTVTDLGTVSDPKGVPIDDERRPVTRGVRF